MIFCVGVSRDCLRIKRAPELVGGIMKHWRRTFINDAIRESTIDGRLLKRFCRRGAFDEGEFHMLSHNLRDHKILYEGI